MERFVLVPDAPDALVNESCNLARKNSAVISAVRTANPNACAIAHEQWFHTTFRTTGNVLKSTDRKKNESIQNYVYDYIASFRL